MNRDIRIGLIGGTGLGEAAASAASGGGGGQRHDIDTPFGRPSAPILTTRWQGVEVAIVRRHGEGHILNPAAIPARANIYALKQLGVTHIVASGAVGSLRERIRPRDLVIVDQLIDRTRGRAGTFYEKAAVHIEFAEPFCPVLRRWLLEAGRRAGRDAQAGEPALNGVTVHDGGTYLCMEGPAFSTRAESHLHRNWGADLIGMTALPEAKLAREAELPYALIALATDYDCWRPHDPAASPRQLLEEITANLEAASDNAIALIRRALTDTALLERTPSPATDALKLAIWSDKTKIPRDEIERLKPLWGRYFE